MDRPRVPVEVTEHIINFLAWDVKTLRSCALVCRSWNPRSRYHLFYSISVTPYYNRTPYALVNLFQSHPEIPSWVHSVTVYCCTSVYSGPIKYELGSVHDVAVICLLPYLLHLTRWRFKNLHEGRYGADQFAFRPTGLMCLARYSCIESLQIENCWLRRVDLSRIVSSFPRLKNLYCAIDNREFVSTYGGGGHNIQGVAASRFPRKANIQQLTVSSLYLSRFIAAT